MKEISRSYSRRIRRIALVSIAIFLTLCALSSSFTLAVCRIRVDYSALLIDGDIAEFLSQQDNTASDLILLAEQIVDRHFGLLVRPSRGAWNKGIYHCRNGECELQHLTVEIAIEAIAPCIIDETGTTLGVSEFTFDIPGNRVEATTWWYDRPVMQDAGIRLSVASPTMDQAANSISQRERDTFHVGADRLVAIIASRDHWKIEVSDIDGTEIIEEDVPFNQSIN